MIRLGSIMRPLEDGQGGPELERGLLLEDAARRFAGMDGDTARVIDESGRVVGMVTVRDVLAAMVRG